MDKFIPRLKMDKFIHRENLALFRRRLKDPGLTDAQRIVILRLLTEEHAERCETAPSMEGVERRPR
jgi:hypothetical protein